MEESYRNLLDLIVNGNRLNDLEYRITEAHKVVAAKRKFEQAMDKAYKQANAKIVKDRF